MEGLPVRTIDEWNIFQMGKNDTAMCTRRLIMVQNSTPLAGTGRSTVYQKCSNLSDNSEWEVIFSVGKFEVNKSTEKAGTAQPALPSFANY